MKIIQRRRRQGQGMTEYIVIVGLIAILLIAAITRYKEQVRVTIEGSAKATDDISEDMGTPVDSADPDNPNGVSLPPGSNKVADNPDGSAVWAAPNGQRYTVRNGVVTPGG